MQNKILLELDSARWTDVIAPDKDTFDSIAKQYNLPRKVLYNSLDPDYLPHLETYGTTQFIIVRFPEPDSSMTADTIQELTTKVAIFINRQNITSIHRLPLNLTDQIKHRLTNFKPEEQTSWLILTLFFEQVALQLDSPLNELEQKMEAFEQKIFLTQKTKALLQEGYYIKRKASSYKKIIKFTLDVIQKLSAKSECSMTVMQEVRDRLERCQFYADDVYENIQGLLNLHMAIASQKTNEASFRTNEIVRVLTVLSIFFLPLNFLAGLYGMNFEHIPLLKDENGFWYSLGFMFSLSSLLLIYVLKKGWIVPPPKDKT